MRSLISRSLQAVFITSLGLTLIGGVVDSVAQAAPGQKFPNGARIFRQRLGAKDHSQQVPAPASTPLWSILLPTYNDPDAITNLMGHSAVYDSGSNTMIVFGGLDQNFVAHNNILLETNANGIGGLQGGAWSELGPISTPPSRTFHSAVYDQTNNRMIVFGGCADGAECVIPLNDTWVLSNANGLGGAPTWTQLTPSGALPSPRSFPNTVYDSTNNRMIVYSGEGAGYTSLSDVWVLSNANGLGGTPAWTQLTPTGGTPDALNGSTAVYDPTTNTMIIFGGGSFDNSVWTLSNANGLTGTPNWTNLIPNKKAGSPPGRYDAQAVYDSTNNRMTIYGGSGDFGTNNPDFDLGTFGDVWVLANANGSGGSPTWTQLHPKWSGDGFIQPGTRTWFSAVRDSGTNTLMIFGGSSIETTYSGAWVLTHANGL